MKNTKKEIISYKALVVIIVVAVLTVVSIAFYTTKIRPIRVATKEYNEMVERYNANVDIYNNKVCEVSVENIDGMPEKMYEIRTEDTGFFAAAKALAHHNSSDKIMQDIKIIKESNVLLEKNIKIVDQIKAPDEKWVISRIARIWDIIGIEAVTDETDINRMLGKPEGYISCIYFDARIIDKSTIPGSTVAERGTDGGGAIEIYDSLEKAKNRCDYLSQFDGTVLYSGSYAIVGTMVIRTSYKLSNEEQFELTDKITKFLTDADFE